MSEFKRIIPIFVIGSTDLKIERDKLASAIVNLNSEIEPDIHLRLRSWEHFQNNQTAYNNFIENTAEVIIVLIDGKLEDESRKEIRRANAHMLAHNTPTTILPFISTKTDFSSVDGSFVKGACSILGHNDDYWITYSNANELAEKVQTELRKYIRQRTQPNNIFKIIANWIKKHLIMLLILISVLFLLLVGIIKYYHEQTVLLVTGGGSAVNYVDRYHPKLDIWNYKGGYCVHMPSGDTWRLLGEEVTSPVPFEDKRYIPTSLSATKYREEDLLETTTAADFIKRGSVIEFLLGYDTLEVMIQNTTMVTQEISQKSIDNHQITTNELSNILIKLKDSINIFTTSPHSGTKYLYADVLKKFSFDLLTWDVLRFEEDSELPHIIQDGTPFVILGSKCYYVKQLKNEIDKGNVLTFDLFNPAEQTVVKKPIYFYCMAYRKENSNTLRIPYQTLNFLKGLNINLERKVQNECIRIKTDKKIIIDFNNDLLDW